MPPPTYTVESAFAVSQTFTSGALLTATLPIGLADYIWAMYSWSLAWTITAGSYLEYDLQWLDHDAEIALDLYVANLDEKLGAAVDQNGYDADTHEIHIDPLCYRTWYHRIIALPVGWTGEVLSRCELTAVRNVAGTWRGQVRNVRITDGAGTTRLAILTIDVTEPPVAAAFSGYVPADTSVSTMLLGATDYSRVGTALVGTARVGESPYTEGWQRLPKIRSIDISRGRTNQLGRWEAGRMTVILDDQDGYFSPWNASSPYADIGPSKPIRCVMHWDDQDWPLFTGFIERLTPSRPLDPDYTVSIQCFDQFGLLARSDINIDLVEELTGDRIRTIVAVAGDIAETDIDDGLFMCAASSADPERLLLHLLDVTALEDGQTWISGNGALVWRDAVARYTRPESTTEQFLFGTGGVGLENYAADYSTDETRNHWTVSRSSGAEQVKFDADSIAKHRLLSETYTSDLIRSDADAEVIARTRLSFYGWPSPRLESIMFARNGSDSHWAAITGLELNQCVRVTQDAGHLGLDELFWVEQIHHIIDFKPQYHHRVEAALTAIPEGTQSWGVVGSALVGTATVAPF